MHVRFSSCKGLRIVDEAAGEMIGLITDILIHPDTGKVEGFFVGGHHLFLASSDIARFGAIVAVRRGDGVGPVDELIRLKPLLSDPRTVLGQRILTESGKNPGRCRDVQFDTKTFRLEWIFPRWHFLWGTALPVSSIVEIRPDAIIVRDTVLPQKEERRVGAVLEMLEKVPLNVPHPG